MRLGLLALSLFVVLPVTPAHAPGVPKGISLLLDQVLARSERLEPLQALLISQGGDVIAERGYDGHGPDEPTNIKSASKAVMSALIGVAIEKGILQGEHQRIAPLLKDALPNLPDPRLNRITVGHLLSMQSGLEPTSGRHYGAWVASKNWVRAVLERPFVDDPGGEMLYSTGSTHLLSALLTTLTGRSTRELAELWLSPVQDFAIAGWQRDPQGIYLGGNEMSMSPRSLLAFGELYRNGGRTPEGQRVVPERWVEASWRRRTHSRHSGQDYGYGWYLMETAGHDVRFAWGYGGQMLYVVPSLQLTVVMTSNPNRPSASTGHLKDLHALLAEIIEAVQVNPPDTANGSYVLIPPRKA